MSSVIPGVITSHEGAALSIGDSFRRLEFAQHSQLLVHGMHVSSSEVHLSCVIGRVIVAICDLRASSSSFMQVQLLELTAFHGDGVPSSPSSVVVPAGCARGVVSIFDSAPSSVITLKANNHDQDSSDVSAIAWDDPTLSIAWPPLSKPAPSCQSFSRLPPSFTVAASRPPPIASPLSNSPIRCASNPYAPSVILLSGGAGFIGSHVIRHIVNKYADYTVINLDVLDHCSTLNNLADVSDMPNYRFVHGDICNLDLVDYVFKINQARSRSLLPPLATLLLLTRLFASGRHSHALRCAVTRRQFFRQQPGVHQDQRAGHSRHAGGGAALPCPPLYSRQHRRGGKRFCPTLLLAVASIDS